MSRRDCAHVRHGKVENGKFRPEFGNRLDRRQAIFHNDAVLVCHVSCRRHPRPSRNFTVCHS
jgi:hypothetical protein